MIDSAGSDHPLAQAAPSGPASPEARRTVSRSSVMRRLVNLYDDARYLEVGVCEGATFHRVPAAHKVAVDPEFRFDHVAAGDEDATARYYQTTSDEYFASLIDPAAMFDVIFLDGLHTADQTLRDLMNALAHLQPRGVVVLDDTRPPTHLAATADRQTFFEVRSWLGGTDQRWMGDVFKTVYFVASFMPALRYATIENNHGQTVIWRPQHDRVEPRRQRTLTEVAAMTFEDMVQAEDGLALARFGDIRRALRRDLGL